MYFGNAVNNIILKCFRFTPHQIYKNIRQVKYARGWGKYPRNVASRRRSSTKRKLITLCSIDNQSIVGRQKNFKRLIAQTEISVNNNLLPTRIVRPQRYQSLCSFRG